MSVFDAKTELLPRNELPTLIAGLGSEGTEPASSLSGRVFALETISKLSRSGLLVIDAQRVVRFLNAQARSMLAGNGVLGIRHGRLAVERSESQRAFESLLGRATAALSAGTPVGEAIGLPDRSGATRFALCVVEVEGRGDEAEVLLSLTDFADNTGPARSAFSTVLGLSVREAELAELFARGLSLEEIAVVMGIAFNTARVHLQRICLKTNCSGQIALTRLLCRLSSMPLPAALEP